MNAFSNFEVVDNLLETSTIATTVGVSSNAEWITETVSTPSYVFIRASILLTLTTT
jgi:hypothetical protein